jgi:hypothetical protein
MSFVAISREKRLVLPKWGDFEPLAKRQLSGLSAPPAGFPFRRCGTDRRRRRLPFPGFGKFFSHRLRTRVERGDRSRCELRRRFRMRRHFRRFFRDGLCLGTSSCPAFAARPAAAA